MAKDITVPVGPTGCPNLPNDIRTLQEMLNLVPVHMGGPKKPLFLDGKATPEFWEALGAFHAKDPKLWSEKTKVIPGGLTLASLNQFDPLPALTVTSTVVCPHGGSVIFSAASRAGMVSPTLSLASVGTIAGCPFLSPCTTLKWLSSPTTQFLDARSVGLCIGANGAPQGPPIIVKA